MPTRQFLQVSTLEPVEHFRRWENRFKFPNALVFIGLVFKLQVIIKGVITLCHKKEQFRFHTV